MILLLHICFDRLTFLGISFFSVHFLYYTATLSIGFSITYTADTIEVRDYENPSILIEVLSKKDDEFSISLRDYRWVQLVPSSVDNSPYTRLQIDLIRLNNNTFRVDYIKAEYAYDPQRGEEEYLVRIYGEPGAYIFEHRNGCWNLTQKLQ